MIRLWYLDGDYQDIPINELHYHIMDPALKSYEILMELENGKPTGRYSGRFE